MAKRIQVTHSPVGHPKRPYIAKVDGVLLTSPAGKTSRFATLMAAERRAKHVLDEKDQDAAMRASYANEPPVPHRTLGQMLGRYFR